MGTIDHRPYESHSLSPWLGLYDQQSGLPIVEFGLISSITISW